MARFAPRVKSLFSVVVLLAIVAGCGRGVPVDGFKGARGQVSGTITLDGEPLQKGCQVIFMADKGGYTASGVVQNNGLYSLSYRGGNGLPTGGYLVQLTAPIVPDSKEPVDPTMMGAKLKIGGTNKGTESTDAGPFPSKYASTTTSKLQFKVESKQNTADFKLEKK